MPGSVPSDETVDETVGSGDAPLKMLDSDMNPYVSISLPGVGTSGGGTTTAAAGLRGIAATSNNTGGVMQPCTDCLLADLALLVHLLFQLRKVSTASAARSRAGKSAALRQAKTFSCSSRDAGCTRGRLLLVLVGGRFLPPRRFNIADCPPSRSCVIGDDKSLPDEARRVGAWRARGARGGRQGGGRRGQNAPRNTSNATLRVNPPIADSFEKA